MHWREAILAAARAGDDLAGCPNTINDKGWPVARIVRVIEYDVPDRDSNGTGELITMITTITDVVDASVEELAATYHERREQETGHNQLRT